ncbi:MAG: aminotransferase class V-fold PLP-dependent enzyme [Ignavibacteriales bacterium]|nr:aminotransferase class V-fold PLP-dependent enzyme [Ignavibacteriales bacterium]
MHQSIEYFRSRYPFLQSGHIYFNHAATSPLSFNVLEKIEEFLVMRSTGAIDDFTMVLGIIAKAKALTAALINTTGDRIAFVDNTTNGINLLAQGMQWQSGDEVVLNDIEFPANVYPFLNLQSKGVSVVFAKAHDGIVSAEDIIAACTSKTKLVSVSFVQFLTGYRADMKLLGEYCRKHNIIFCVDAIQGLGALPLDVKECCIDFLSSGTQKWLMGNMGLAFIYITEELQQRLRTAYAGWLSVEDAWNLLHYELIPKKSAEAFQPGTLNLLGICSYLGALELFEESGQAYREQRILDNTEYLREQLTAHGYKPLLHGVKRENLSGITSFVPVNPDELFAKLSKAHVTCSLREGMIRFAPHYYNTKEEIDAAVKEL